MRLPLFDAHCDTLSAMQAYGKSLWQNDLHVDLCRGRRYAPWAQFFAIFGLLEAAPSAGGLDFPIWASGEACFTAQYALFQEVLLANRDHMVFCRTAAEAEGATREGKVAAFLSVEGAELLDCGLERLTEAHGLGVRMVTLTWNRKNALSGTNLEVKDQGLTELGREFVRKCEALGVIVDVSHLSEPGFWDVAEEMKRPFVASHSNATAVFPHSRSLTDAQFLAIVKARGVAGLNLYSAFVGADPDVDKAIAHIEHFLSLGGEKSVAIGADLDGCDSLPRGVAGIQDLEKLAEGLLRRNYTEALVADVFYQNLFRVVREVCDI